MLPNEVLILDMMYLSILLAYVRSLSVLPVKVGFLQSGLLMLTKSFCHVEAMKDDECHVIVDQNGAPRLKIPNLTLNYHTPTWWHGMLCIACL